jgi:hypothetical protein
MAVRCLRAPGIGRLMLTVRSRPEDPDSASSLGCCGTDHTAGRVPHGISAAYIHGCICSDCRAYQKVRMGRKRATDRLTS